MERSDINGCAIDIGGTKTAAARIKDGQIVARVNRATNGASDLDGYLNEVQSILTELNWDEGRDPVALTVTGRVTKSLEWSAINSGTLTEINNAPLGRAAKDRFGAVTISNDAAATALAEYHFGAGTGARSFIYMTISTGVGGGIVLNGKLLESAHGLAGHVGFATVHGNHEICGCGREGTAESAASGKAIARMAAEAGYPELSGQDVFEAALRHEAWANDIINRSAKSVADLCASLVAILEPDCIAIGGSVGLAKGYIGRVSGYLAQQRELFRRPIKRAQLMGDGPLLGALAHGLKDQTQ